MTVGETLPVRQHFAELNRGLNFTVCVEQGASVATDLDEKLDYLALVQAFGTVHVLGENCVFDLLFGYCEPRKLALVQRNVYGR